MSNFVIALIRTVVPMGVGVLATWLINLGVNVDQSAFEGLNEALVLFIGGLYYALIRYLEGKFPWFGWLLGVAKAPEYDTSA